MSLSPASDPQTIIDTEAAILAAAIRGADVRDVVLLAMKPGWFLNVEHRLIFGALRTLGGAPGAIDFASILREVRRGRASTADDVIGEEWVWKAQALGRGITGDSVAHAHLPLLREAYQLREMESLQLDLGERVTRASTAGEVIAWTRQRLDAIADERDLEPEISDADAVAMLLRAADGGDTEAGTVGTLTGIAELDAQDFRLKPRQALVIGARPSHGKTSLAMQIALGISPHVGVAYFALEDGLEGWQDRRAMMLTGEVPGRVRYNKAKPRVYEILGNFVQAARESDVPLWVFDNNRSYTPADIISISRRIKRKHPSLGAVFIDQMYDIVGWSRRGAARDEAPNQIVGELIDGFRELDVCPVFVQQLNRNAQKAIANSEPSMTDFSDSDVFGKRARQILLVWRPNFDEGESLDINAVIKIEKNSHGRRGRIDVPWEGPRVRIGTWEDPLQIQAEGYPKRLV
jgi:replicative DNA helicase